MDNSIIIMTLVKAIKDGNMTIDNVPTAYREQVEEIINNERQDG
jgi:hypothetical protein